MNTSIARPVIAIFFALLLYSCSPMKKANRRSDNFYENLLGKWAVNKKSAASGNYLVRGRSLPKGVVIFYPNSRFMYRSQNGRYNGHWELKRTVDWMAGTQLDVTHSILLSFDDNETLPMQDAEMELLYAKQRKMKFIAPGNLVNIFER